MKTSTKLLGAGAGCLAVTAVFCAGSSAIAVYAAMETNKLNDAQVACDHRPVPGVTPSSGARRVAGFQRRHEGDGWSYAGNLLPHAWDDAEEVTDVDVVLCFEAPERVTVETCGYDDGWDLHRVQQRRVGYAVEASSGRELARVELEGDLPEACPDRLPEDYGDRVSFTEREVVGGDVGRDRVAGAFDAVVAGTPLLSVR